MKKNYLPSLLLLIILFITHVASSQSNIYEGYVIINTNNSGNYYFDLEQTPPNNSSFNGTNLGTFAVDNGSCTNSSTDLILNGGQNKIYKCGSDDVLDGELFYRVYPTGFPSGAYTSLSMAFSSYDGVATCGGELQTWEVSNAGINLLSGRNPGNYTLEVYTQANFTYATGSGTHYMNNGGANYLATFSVNDTQNPAISCPANITVSNDVGLCSAVVNYTTPVGTDNCAGASTTQTAGLASGSAFPVGTTTNTFRVTDADGNFVECSFTITVNDTQNPSAICQNISIPLDAFGNATITLADINNNSTDNCGIASMNLSQTTFDCTNIGDNTVTLTVIDIHGNIATCNSTVTVTDIASNSNVTITSSPISPICLSTEVTFTAIPFAGGTTPTYNWFINGISQGNNSPIFITSSLNNGDSVRVDMRSSLSPCAIFVPSNTIMMTVNSLPVVSSPSPEVCVNSSMLLTPATSGWAIISGPGSVNIGANGLITGTTPGLVTLRYTDTNGCTSDLSITVNPLPIVNVPTAICVNDIITLDPASSGWAITSGGAFASLDATGYVLTGNAAGSVTLTYTDANGCSSASVSIIVKPIPTIIGPIITNPASVCSGDPSLLSVNVQGTGGNDVTLVNYNFNDINPSSYATLNAVRAAGITSTITPNNLPLRTEPGVASGGNAFTSNPIAGNALRQWDNQGNNDDGDWTFDIGGTNLNTYQDFSFYFQTRRTSARGNNKYVNLYYRVNGIGNFIYLGNVFLNDNNQGTQWQEVLVSLPASVINANQLEIRLNVTDGYGGSNSDTPDILVDNFQLQGKTASEIFTYSWAADTGYVNGGLQPGVSTSTITVNPLITTIYTVTVTNSLGCSATRSQSVTVYPSPEIIINANYCPADVLGTTQDESQMVQLVASANQPIISWQWLTTPVQTGNTIYVDIADIYQVIGVTANNCSESASISVAQELVVNGDFTQGNVGFNSDYTYRPDINGPQLVPAGQGELYNDTVGPGTPPAWVNGYSITTDGNYVHTNFHGPDHTANTISPRNFMAVNGHGTQYVVWSQIVNVQPGTEYYFAAWARSLNNAGPYGKLRFRVNGVQIGLQLNLGSYPTNDWGRFYGTWPLNPSTSTISGPILIEIVNNENSFGGNDFGIDDISFGTLSTFIRLTSAVNTDAQTVCDDTAIIDITYDIGGGLTSPQIEWFLNGGPSLGINVFPNGLSSTFNGLSYNISGIPTVPGDYTYEISTTSTCDIKKAIGALTVTEAAIVNAGLDQTVCQSIGSVNLSASINGSALNSTLTLTGTWTSSNATGSFNNINNPNAIYTFGPNETGTTTLTFTSNDPDGAGPCNVVSDTVLINITPYLISNAGADINLSASNCDVTTTNLAANTLILGTTGLWTVTSGQDPSTYSFSNLSIPNSTFTGQSGETYTLQWTVTNTAPCLSTNDSVNVIFANCGDNIVFDGVDDAINFANNFNFTGNFSIEAWVKPNTVSGNQTIISKRDANLPNTGYTLRLNNNLVTFNYNTAGSVIANQFINNARWYHVAVTYNNGTYNMYIDGINVRTINGTIPNANTKNCLVGASNSATNIPVNYFSGSLDELRIWNSSLSVQQIQEMMNQEIENNIGNVRGSIIPLDITGLAWTDLLGYYQMNQGTPDVAGGFLNEPGFISGKLLNMTNLQAQTAPIPYISSQNGNWTTNTTWLNGTVQLIPNTNGVDGSPINWNIIRTATNVNSTNKNITVLGLLVDNNTLSIQNTNPTDGQSLRVTKYLKIDGILDLVGESQLLQPMGSILGSGTGVLQRDQQGTTNPFNYNYWGNPVNSFPNSFTIASTLRDGTNPNNPISILWTSGLNSIAGTPITLSRRWLYTYENYPNNSYADWREINENSPVNVGLGFIMKGSSAAGTLQNYTFVGQPNNGTITSFVSQNYQALVGNPYPSAIDSREFIKDNIPGSPPAVNPGSTQSIDGTLYFWEHAPSNATHVLSAYEGGYSYLNLSGGVAAVSPPEINGLGNANKIPKRYVPVGQGFYVTASPSGGLIQFKNSQRSFVKESSGASEFFRTDSTSTDEYEAPDSDDYKKIRLEFKTPEGATRRLLLAFTPNNEATDGFDYGYDAVNTDDLPNDMSFLIENKKYIIQGVGSFDDTNIYPISIKLSVFGTIEISLTDIENFDETVDVFVYDALLGTYTQINSMSYQIALEAGDYNNRYFITFREDATLSTVDEDFKDVIVNFLLQTDEIYIKTPYSISVKQIYLINIAGQTVASWNATNVPLSNEIKIPVRDISEGSYILQLETNTSTFHKKIIIKY